MKKILKSRIFQFIVTAIIFTGIGVLADNLNASEVNYNDTTVEEALDTLYERSTYTEYTGPTTVIPSTSVQTLQTKNKLLKGIITIDAIPSTFKDLSTASDFEASDLLSGKKAYNSNGVLVEGTGTSIAPSTKTLIWVNENPTAAFNSTTVTLTSSLSNFTHFLVIYKNNKTDTVTYENIFKVDPIRYTSTVTAKWSIAGRETSGSKQISRGIFVPDGESSNKLQIGGAYWTDAGSTLNNNFLIPIYIYGLNLSY